MKTYILLFACTFFILMGRPFIESGSDANLMAQNPTHANTPIEIYPFSNYLVPNYMWFEEGLPYKGAAREYEYPSDVESVKIGFIGSLDGAQEYYSLNGQQMLQGSKLAIEQANSKGGYQGEPFELIARNDIGLWGASGDELVKLDDMGVVAAIGSIDGNNTHVAIRVALKLEIPMVNTGSTDPTLTDTRIPWVIRTNQDDRQFNFALLNEAYNLRGYTRVAILRANSRYARVGTRMFVDGARRLGTPVTYNQAYLPGEMDFSLYLEKIREVNVEAVLLWGEVDEIARIVKQMREAGMEQTILTSDKVVSDTFKEIAGIYAEGVVATFPYNPESNNPDLKQFNEEYRARFGMEANSFAIQAYDGTKILIDAIHKAGLNRALIRDEITSIKEVNGITGTIRLDGSWNNVSPVYIAEFHGGKFHFRQFEWLSVFTSE